MRKKTLLSLAAALLTVPAALLLAKKWRALPEEEIPADDETVAGENMVSFPLKDRYMDFSSGPDEPKYIFVLELPNGTKEIPVTLAHYETYYIGDEVICREENGQISVV